MTWEQLAPDHIDSEDKRHRGVLLDPRRFRCLDCSVTLVIPREPKTLSPSGPPPYRYTPPAQPASPDLVALRKREVEAAIELARQKRTTVEEP